jgi:hypothetical protein
VYAVGPLIEQLDALLEKSSFGNKEVGEATVLLYQLCKGKNEFAAAADYIMKFQPAVCASFCTAYLHALTLFEWEYFFAELLVNEQFAANSNNSGAIRGFALLSALGQRIDALDLRQAIWDRLWEIAGEKSGAHSGKIFREFLWDLLEQKNQQIAELTVKIDNLSERLRLSFQMDAISRNQEVLSLKKNIAGALKIQYDDYVENRNTLYSEANYEAFKVDLNQVFRVLKRFGIEFNSNSTEVTS